MKAIVHWIKDYFHLVKGGMIMYLHANPPTHYLGYIVRGKCAIVILPGILNRWGFLKPIADSLSLDGHPVYIVPHLNYNLAGIPESAKIAGEVMEREGIQDAVIIGHSKGGLIGKYLMSRCDPDGRVIGMVAIATPFSGSALAKFVPHAAFRELEPGSRIVEELRARTGVNRKIISIIPEFDNHVVAQEGSFLEEALENVVVNVKGHHKVVFDARALAVVKQAVEKIAQR